MKRIYVVCNNDDMYSATFDEEQAKEEVLRLKNEARRQFDAGSYFHYHMVNMLAAPKVKPVPCRVCGNIPISSHQGDRVCMECAACWQKNMVIKTNPVTNFPEAVETWNKAMAKS